MTFALIADRPMSRSELRAAIPYPILAKIMSHGAITGVLPVYDLRGEECSPAQPLTAQQRIDLCDKLLRKGLPDLKGDEAIETPAITIQSIPSDPEQIKRMTFAEIKAAVEAEFTKVPHADQPAP